MLDMMCVLDFLQDQKNVWAWHALNSIFVIIGFGLVIRQLRIAHDQNSINHLSYFRELWNSETLLRARLSVLESSDDSESELRGSEDVIATFMEDLGAAVHYGQVHREHVYNYYVYYTDGYWQILKNKVICYRKKTYSDEYFIRFEDLFNVLRVIDRKFARTPMPESYVDEFRKEESRAVRFMLNQGE